MTHHISTFDIGVAAGLGRAALDNDARQRYVDTVYSQAIAHEEHHAATGQLSAEGYNVIIERNGLYNRKIYPSWAQGRQTGQITVGYLLLMLLIAVVLSGGFMILWGLIFVVLGAHGHTMGIVAIWFGVASAAAWYAWAIKREKQGNPIF